MDARKDHNLFNEKFYSSFPVPTVYKTETIIKYWSLPLPCWYFLVFQNTWFCIFVFWKDSRILKKKKPMNIGNWEDTISPWLLSHSMSSLWLWFISLRGPVRDIAALLPLHVKQISPVKDTAKRVIRQQTFASHLHLLLHPLDQEFRYLVLTYPRIRLLWRYCSPKRTRTGVSSLLCYRLP